MHALKTMKFHIQLLEQDGKWRALVMDVPGVEATGETQHEAIEMAAALAVSTIDNYRALTRPAYGAN
jgi:predicted RNase H-like HicB family nuclease